MRHYCNLIDLYTTPNDSFHKLSAIRVCSIAPWPDRGMNGGFSNNVKYFVWRTTCPLSLDKRKTKCKQWQHAIIFSGMVLGHHRAKCLVLICDPKALPLVGWVGVGDFPLYPGVNFREYSSTSWRVRLAKQETQTHPGHLVSPLIQRPWMSTVVLRLPNLCHMQ